MPIKNILFPDYNLVYTRFHGTIDNLQLRAHTDQLRHDLAPFESYCGLIDFSQEADFGPLSSAELAQAGARVKQFDLARTGPLAVLVANTLTYGLARTYSTFASEAHTNLLISYNLDECLAFMGLNERQSLQVQKALSRGGTRDFTASEDSRFNFRFPLDN